MNYIRSALLILFSAFLGLNSHIYAMQKAGSTALGRFGNAITSAFARPNPSTTKTPQLTLPEPESEKNKQESAGIFSSFSSLAQRAKNALTSGSTALTSGLQSIQIQADQISSAAGLGVKKSLGLTFFPATASKSATQPVIAYKPELIPSAPAARLSPEEIATQEEDENEHLLENIENVPVEPVNDSTIIPEQLAETAHEEGSPLWYETQAHKEGVAKLRQERSKLQVIGGIIAPNCIKIKELPKSQKPTIPQVPASSSSVKCIGGVPMVRNARPIQPIKNIQLSTNTTAQTQKAVQRKPQKKAIIVSPASPLSSVLPHNSHADFITYGNRIMPVIPASAINTAPKKIVHPKQPNISGTPSVAAPKISINQPINPVISRITPVRGRPRKIQITPQQPARIQRITQSTTALTQTLPIQNVVRSAPTLIAPQQNTQLAGHSNYTAPHVVHNPFPELHRILEHSTRACVQHQSHNNFSVYAQELQHAQTAQFVPVLIDTELANTLLMGTGFSYKPNTISSIADMHGNTVAVFGKTIEGLIPCYVTQQVAEKITNAMEKLTQTTQQSLRSAQHTTRALTYERQQNNNANVQRYTLRVPNSQSTATEQIKRFFIFTRQQEHATNIFNAMQRATQRDMRRPTSLAITHSSHSANTHIQTPLSAPGATASTSAATNQTQLPQQAELMVLKQVNPQENVNPKQPINATHNTNRSQENRRIMVQPNTQGHHEENRHRQRTTHTGTTDSSEGNDTFNNYGNQYSSHDSSTTHTYDYVNPTRPPVPLLPTVQEIMIPNWLFDNGENNAGSALLPPDNAPQLPPPPQTPTAPAPPAADAVDPNEQLIPDWMFKEKEPTATTAQTTQPTTPTEEKVAEPASPENTAQQEKVAPKYQQQPHNENSYVSGHEYKKPSEGDALSRLPKPSEWPHGSEQPYHAASYAPAYNAQPAHAGGNYGNTGAPSYGGQYIMPAAKNALERTPYTDTVVKPFRKAFSVLTPSELAKKRQERAAQKK